MPEQIRKFITTDDIKLLAVVVSLLFTGFITLNELENKVNELSVLNDLDARQDTEQVEAVRELTKAVQELNITSVQLEARLKNLERVFPEFKR